MTRNQQVFFDFVQLREEAREAKELGLHPHSDDPIIRQYSFCNINREHDRVTRWIDLHVRKHPELMASVNQMVLALSVCRIINNPDALNELVFPGMDLDDACAVVLARQARGQSVFRGAYMMPSHGTKDQQRVSPINYYFDRMKTIQAMDFQGCLTLQEAAEMLLSVHGFGTFIVNQIVTDLRYTPHFADAPDWGTFIWGGPGTSRGLCRFFDQPKLSIDRKQPWIQERLMEVRLMADKHLPAEILAHYVDPNNLSNSFCEYDKYMRMLNNESGRLRQYKSK